MVKFSISNARYTYVHDQKYPSKDVDIHHIISRRRSAKYFVYATAFLVLACALYLYVLKEKSISLVYYSLLFDVCLVKLLLRKPVKKESVVIMPAFGVQLETHYVSGKVFRCFVPIDKILKPVLIECVTPVTCYWTLSLIIRGESEMVLVFKAKYEKYSRTQVVVDPVQLGHVPWVWKTYSKRYKQGKEAEAEGVKVEISGGN